ncbi:hypothetical protein ACIRQQ_16990 [Streptomyces fuscichromogenes]|uniref:hypothetical protein n=1 Tax=Streptomyces fuscichromogenes TaxID=1324013 RepID=UPI00380D84B2
MEDDFQDAKEICHLDKGQFTCWNSWHSRSAITLVAYAFLATSAALERAAHTGRNGPAKADLVPLRSHGFLCLRRDLILPPPRRDRDHLLWWFHLVPMPSTPRSPLPSPMAHLCRHHTMIRPDIEPAAIYSCRA